MLPSKHSLVYLDIYIMKIISFWLVYFREFTLLLPTLVHSRFIVVHRIKFKFRHKNLLLFKLVLMRRMSNNSNNWILVMESNPKHVKWTWPAYLLIKFLNVPREYPPCTSVQLLRNLHDPIPQYHVHAFWWMPQNH